MLRTCLADAIQAPHIRSMSETGKRAANPFLRTILFAIGIALILSAPLVGLLPGPGGIVVLAGGLVLALKNSAWARRNFARWKRRWPRAGGLADRALRRRSARRRRDRAREAALARAEAIAAGFEDPAR